MYYENYCNYIVEFDELVAWVVVIEGK